MLIFAVVGAIGAGKSTICRLLRDRHGAHVVDADQLAHRLLDRPPVKAELLAAFGADIVRAGRVDRRRLGALVFGHPARLERLNRIVHPPLGRLLRARLGRLRRAGVRTTVLDAALYFDVDLGLRADAVLVVTAPRALRRQRLAERDGLGRAAIEARLASQPRVGAWTRRADVRLDTRGPRSELGPRVDAAWKALHRAARRRRREALEKNPNKRERERRERKT